MVTADAEIAGWPSACIRALMSGSMHGGHEEGHVRLIPVALRSMILHNAAPIFHTVSQAVEAVAQ